MKDTDRLLKRRVKFTERPPVERIKTALKIIIEAIEEIEKDYKEKQTTSSLGVLSSYRGRIFFMGKDIKDMTSEERYEKYYKYIKKRKMKQLKASDLSSKMSHKNQKETFQDF